MLFEQIIANNPSPQLYEHICSEIALLHFESRQDILEES